MTDLTPRHPCLLDFKNVRPSNEAGQGETLQWLARMHTEAERSKASASGTEFDAESFHDRMRKLFNRVGCSPERIGRRGYEIAEGAHSDWAGIKIYDVAENPDGAGSLERTELYSRAAGAAMDRLYA